MRKYIKNKISIIIPTYNEETNIARLIDELKNEIKNSEFEIIIVDDGSTDNTSNIIKKASLKYTWITYIRNEKKDKRSPGLKGVMEREKLVLCELFPMSVACAPCPMT